MPFTDGGIFYRPLAPSPTLTFAREEQSAEEIYMMAWDALDDFVDESLPEIQNIGSFTVPQMRRSFPDRDDLQTERIVATPFYGEMPGDLDGTLVADGVEAAKWARVTISYKVSEESEQDPTQDPNDPETFLTHRRSMGGEWFIQQGVPEWVDASATDDAAVADGDANAKINKNPFFDVKRFIPTIEHSLIWKAVLDPPFDAIIALLGTLNDELLFGAQAETMLFIGAEAEREFTNRGQKPWRLDLRFRERKDPDWNTFWNPEVKKWQRILWKDADGNKEPTYPTGDHSFLFQQAGAGVVVG